MSGLIKSKENARRLLHCLDEFGFGSLGLKADDFTQKDNVVQLGYPPRRIDLITGIEGIDFAEAYERHIEVDIDSMTINYIDLKDLIQTKRIAGRLQDLADIEKLEKE